MTSAKVGAKLFSTLRQRGQKKKKLMVQSPEGLQFRTQVTEVRDVFSNNWLVDSPRVILREKTRLEDTESRLASALEAFYSDLVHIEQSETDATVKAVKELSSYLLPRLKKSAKHLGFTIQDVVYYGSAFDGTSIIAPQEADVIVLFDNLKCKVEDLEAGYKFIPLPPLDTRRAALGKTSKEKKDKFSFGRSDDGSYLSSMLVAWRLHALVERSLRFNQAADVQVFNVEDGKAHTTIVYKNLYRIHVTAGTFDRSNNTYLVTRPYDLDENAQSDMLWRVCYPFKEKVVLDAMDLADRGTRIKAFKILKGLFQTEHTLRGLTSFQLKSVLMLTFDGEVDCIPRWQRPTLPQCFRRLLEELHSCLLSHNLPHFFEREFDILKNLDPRKVKGLQMRVNFLLNNEKELMRILRKRQRFVNIDKDGKPRPITL